MKKLKNSRVYNSILNLISGLVYRILILFTAFIVRTVFIYCLGEEYLGINGLYSSILSMLSLAELGFGSAMVFSMYQPLANKDYDKLSQLMSLYQKVYVTIGTAIFIIGIVLIPFLPILIKDEPHIKGLTFYYILFLLNTVVSYWFFAYRNSVLQADQKAFVITNNSSVFSLIRSALQIILLVVFHSYAIYLITQILCTIAQNIVLAFKVKKEYPIFRKEQTDELPKCEKGKIFKDVKALMLAKVSYVVLNSTDNIIISAFVGLNWVGKLSNFTMIVEAVTGVLNQVTSAVQASLGNYFAKENIESGYILFKNIEFLNFWLYGFCMLALVILLNPYVTLWLGSKYILSNGTIIALGINFFVAGYVNTFWTFRSTLGLFTQGQYCPILVSILNVVLSILLSFPFGITGVLMATSISRICVNLWYDPWVIYKYGFRKSVISFWRQYIRRIGVLFLIGFGMECLSNLLFKNGVTYGNFTLMVGLTAIIPNIILYFLFHKTKEFQYFINIIKRKRSI